MMKEEATSGFIGFTWDVLSFNIVCIGLIADTLSFTTVAIVTILDVLFFNVVAKVNFAGFKMHYK